MNYYRTNILAFTAAIVVHTLCALFIIFDESQRGSMIRDKIQNIFPSFYDEYATSGSTTMALVLEDGQLVALPPLAVDRRRAAANAYVGSVRLFVSTPASGLFFVTQKEMLIDLEIYIETEEYLESFDKKSIAKSFRDSLLYYDKNTKRNYNFSYVLEKLAMWERGETERHQIVWMGWVGNTLLGSSLLVGGLSLYRIYCHHRMRARIRKNRCPKCNYDVSATTADQCPECGQSSGRAE